MNLREEVPVNIVKWASLETTMNDLFDAFEEWRQRNAELVDRFFNQEYFTGEESLINKLIEVKPNIDFNEIKDEWINLALLHFEKLEYNFRRLLDNVKDEIKISIKQSIYDNICTRLIWLWLMSPVPPTPWWRTLLYDDFRIKCTVPAGTNVLWYFQDVVDYLESKESNNSWKNALEILKTITITNADINLNLPPALIIPNNTLLSDPSIPDDLRQSFDKLLSFEIGKEADRTVDIAKNLSKDFQKLLTNSLPAINTIVWESDKYRYNEKLLWAEYQWKLQAIKDDINLNESERNKQINDLKREYYIKYLKTKNKKIWNALEELYNNDFDYSKVNPHTLKDYFDKVADIRLSMLFDKSTNGGKCMNEFMKLNFWNIDEFKRFYKQLTDIDPNNPTLNITLSNVNIPWLTPPATWTIRIPIQRKIVEWKNLWLKDIDQFWKNADKSFDAFPMEFTINKADIDTLNITMEDKTKLLYLLSRFDQWDKYEIKWEDIWILIYLFFIMNNKLPITDMDPEEQKEVEKLFWQAKNHKSWPDEEDNKENDKWDENLTPEKFKEEIEKKWPWKFENWSEIWLPMWNSELPWGWYQWMKIKISNVNMKKWTFKWTVFWWELKFNSKLEWKSREFKMNQEFFNDLEKIVSRTTASKDKIWLQPNPSKSDFNSFRENLKNKLWTDNLSFPIEWTTWDGSKFMQKIVNEKWEEKEVEVKYFWALWDDKSTYKIEYNPIRKSFTVSSTFNWDEKWKDWKSEKKRFSYKRDMDWNNFLIFFTQKWLHPQTEEEAKDAIVRQDNEFKMVNKGKWTLNRFSFNNLKNWFKDIIWALKKKVDEYDKSQTEKLKWMIESPILNALWSIPLLPDSIKYAIWERQQEIYNEITNGAWKKIEWYLKTLQSDAQFADTFDQVPPHLKLLWWSSYKDFLVNLDTKANNGSLKDDEVHRAAALLLANVEKWGSPFRWLVEYENKWFWVKILLGKAHYQQFLRDKQKCINDLKKNWKEKDQLQDTLAKCEMDYIINNVTGANWDLPYFGSHEERWIDWKNKYIPNPSQQKLSPQFANKLKDCRDKRFNKSSVEEEFNKIPHNSFEQAKADFRRLLKSARYPGALGNLKKMFLLAKNDEQKSEYQKCFLIYMLSGVLDVNGKKDLRKQTYLWAKTMGFLPWMLAKNTWHSEQVAALLNDFDPEFSKKVKSYFHAWDLKSWNLKIKSLIEELDSRWNVEKMESFEKYSKSNYPSKKFPKNSVLGKLQESALDTGMENIDNSLLDNPLVANSGWLLSSANVVRDRMAIREWSFDWKDPDERNNRAEFWKQIAKEVNDMNENDPESVNLVLNQYFSRFGLNSEADRQKAYKRIKTAYEWRDKIWKPFKYDFNWKGQLLDMGNITWEEIEDIVWYTFQWTVRKDCFSSRKLPSEMEKALISFQKFFKKAFDVWTLNNSTVVKDAFKSDWIKIEPMLLWSRNLYKDVFSWDWEYEYDNTEIWDEKDALKDWKKRRKAQKRAFQTGRFINYEIAQIEKSFKNKIPTGSYRVITQDTSSDIKTRIKWLNQDWEVNNNSELPMAA